MKVTTLTSGPFGLWRIVVHSFRTTHGALELGRARVIALGNSIHCAVHSVVRPSHDRTEQFRFLTGSIVLRPAVDSTIPSHAPLCRFGLKKNDLYFLVEYLESTELPTFGRNGSQKPVQTSVINPTVKFDASMSPTERLSSRAQFGVLAYFSRVVRLNKR